MSADINFKAIGKQSKSSVNEIKLNYQSQNESSSENER
jgi:hypothetical protein